MQKSAQLQDGEHHHKRLLWLCHQKDQSQHLPRQITLPRVIQTKWQHKETMSIDGSNRHIHDIWDKTLHISILENGHNAYFTPADI